jgi:hypothetical protein
MIVKSALLDPFTLAKRAHAPLDIEVLSILRLGEVLVTAFTPDDCRAMKFSTLTCKLGAARYGRSGKISTKISFKLGSSGISHGYKIYELTNLYI